MQLFIDVFLYLLHFASKHRSFEVERNNSQKFGVSINKGKYKRFY